MINKEWVVSIKIKINIFKKLKRNIMEINKIKLNNKNRKVMKENEKNNKNQDMNKQRRKIRIWTKNIIIIDFIDQI